jgi:hypothetical protein
MGAVAKEQDGHLEPWIGMVADGAGLTPGELREWLQDEMLGGLPRARRFQRFPKTNERGELQVVISEKRPD